MHNRHSNTTLGQPWVNFGLDLDHNIELKGMFAPKARKIFGFWGATEEILPSRGIFSPASSRSPMGGSPPVLPP